MKYVFDTKKGKRYEFPTHINEIVVDRSESKMAEVFVVIVEPGKAVHYHAHDDCEQIFYIVEGEGVLVIGPDKKEYDVKPTQIVRIPVKTCHSVRPKGDRPVRYICIDCLGADREGKEPTWEEHVKVMCNEQGWDFNTVAVDKKDQ